MKCDHCGNEVPEGVFCTRCGAHQGVTTELGDPKTRTGHFAAAPGEHVGHPNFFTTLMPHLGQHKIHEFRWAAIAGVAILAILAFTGLIAAAILVAAFLIPILYLMYLYEAQVYRDEPATILGFTIGGGIVLGVILAVLQIKLVNQFDLQPNLKGATVAAGTVILAFVIFPLVQEVVKPLPAVLLLRSRFPETIDGLVFGVASGLGFGLAETLVRFGSLLSTLPFKSDPAAWIYTLLTIGVLSPLMQGTCAGLVAATLWRLGKGRATSRDLGGAGIALAGHILFSLGTFVLGNLHVDQIGQIGWQLLVDVGLVLYMRQVLHHALMDESAHMGLAQTICPNCHRHIVASGFCPNCGVSLGAAPRSVTDNRTPAPAPQSATTTGGA